MPHLKEIILFKDCDWEVVENTWWDLPISIRHTCTGTDENRRFSQKFTYYRTHTSELNKPCISCGLITPSCIITLYILVLDNYLSERPELRYKYYSV